MTMASEMQERIARAICDSRCWPGAFEKANEVERRAWMHDALAAMVAMRQPTREMQGAIRLSETSTEAVWLAMLDAAIEAAKRP